MSEVKLNLARKWRSKQFDEIVGQDLSVRMLKNSLFLQQFFPVYLFSGQRGCGKTTTARVFAAALNCECLATFQKNPQKQLLPCHQCTSCIAMESGKHPDFIEIDAASHTGVDHVRMLIDSASLLPLMGNKKIYLIDEAHMLSKAAFNALLKILEEPPASVIFMLATTDPHKIIETVRSRCFQLFFRSVDKDTLLKQLQLVCDTEKINYDDAGLSQIIKQTEGSVRDALNLLETVRFSHKKVTETAVTQLLGHIEDEAIITLFRAAFSGNARTVLQLIKKLEWHRYTAPLIWERLLELTRAALWIKYDVMPDQFTEYIDDIKTMIRSHSAQQITCFLRNLHDKELLFMKTTAKHDVLEMVLLSLCRPVKKSSSDEGTPSSSQAVPVSESLEDDVDDTTEQEEEDDEEEEEAGLWNLFVQTVNALDDPLLSSVFRQGTVKNHDRSSKIVHVTFSKELVFFSEWLENTKNVWVPVLHKTFGAGTELQPLFSGASTAIKSTKIRTAARAKSMPTPQRPTQPALSQQKNSGYQSSRPKRYTRRETKLFPNEVTIDTSDTTQWPIVHLVKKYMPGTVTEIRE